MVLKKIFETITSRSEEIVNCGANIPRPLLIHIGSCEESQMKDDENFWACSSVTKNKYIYL